MQRKLFDAHLHIIDPRFPLVANQGYLPPAFTVEDYRVRAEQLGVVGGAVVSGSFQAFDQEYLLDALRALGPAFVGVTQLPATVTDEEILRLHWAGVRALRFNVVRGGSAELAHLAALARRVHELVAWHVELYIDSSKLVDLYEVLTGLPAVSIDHLGLSHAGFSSLLKLVERGVHVKASGFGRVDLDARQAIRDICAANPEALMFGSDLPSTRAPRPFAESDIDLIAESLDAEQAERVLYWNAVKFYRPTKLEPRVTGRKYSRSSTL